MGRGKEQGPDIEYDEISSWSDLARYKPGDTLTLRDNALSGYHTGKLKEII